MLKKPNFKAFLQITETFQTENFGKWFKMDILTAKMLYHEYNNFQCGNKFHHFVTLDDNHRCFMLAKPLQYS